MMNQWVEVEGVVRSTDGSHLLLVAEGGAIMATIRSAPATQVQTLVDATVRLRGLDIMATDDRGQFQGIQLVVPSLEQVEVERAAPDPFALTARPIASLFRVSRPKEFSHRVKVEGVLTLREEGRFFLQDSSGAAMAIGREEVILDSPPGPYHWAFVQAPDSRRTRHGNWEFKPGDRVQAVGFPESRGGNSPVLTEVLVRKIGEGPSLQPVKAAVSDILLGKHDSALVSLEAELLAREDLGAHHIFQMQADQVKFQVVTPAVDASSPVDAPGSRLLVTGVCQVEPSPFPELGKRINSFKILVGTADGLVVLERPSWWTIKHALAVAGALLISLVFAGGWIGILRRQVEVRTAQLTREIEERKRIEAEMELGHKKLLRTSRMVGMADVAASVLHNVGNVLNSANMLVALIDNQVRGSKVSTLVKAVNLMGEHRNDLGRFLSEDERGRHLPALLERLADHLASERNRLQDKVGALTESVQHIKDVITRQQKYAKVSTLTETVSLAEVVEDALRLSGGALAEHRIQVVRQYEAAPQLTIDRHKVLQILFNLLENAKRACIECGLPEREVKIQIRPIDGGSVQIRVQDNGVGISPENLSRIFAQHFSTRKDGHGFGLHSSMLAAQDMGGSLAAHSDGLGMGAVFTLQLCPRQP
jgi:signal transduction histidine kinase